MLDACGDAVMVPKFDSVPGVFEGVMSCSHGVGPNALQLGTTSCGTLTLRYGTSVDCADASSVCRTSGTDVPRKSSPVLRWGEGGGGIAAVIARLYALEFRRFSL